MSSKKMQQQTLNFDKYPNSPGWKKDGTSRDAAKKVRRIANTLRDQVLEALRHEAMTSDECAQALGKTPFSVRPRLSELYKLGLIEETGIKRLNDSGSFAVVWRAKQ